MIRRLALVIVGSTLLAACSKPTTISEWSCPSDQPDGCFTVAAGDDVAIAALKAEVTAPEGKVTLRRMPAGAVSDNITTSSGELTANKVIETFKREATAHETMLASPPNVTALMRRLPDRVARIWIGPFEDASGNYHPASILFIIVEPSRWRFDP